MTFNRCTTDIKVGESRFFMKKKLLRNRSNDEISIALADMNSATCAFQSNHVPLLTEVDRRNYLSISQEWIYTYIYKKVISFMWLSKRSFAASV